MDNGGLQPIESDGIDGVARGFFLQDMTYGYSSLDGFVIWYKSADNTWGQTSQIIRYQDYSISANDVDLTNESTYVTNNDWACDISLHDSPTPEYEQVYCTRTVVSANDFDNLKIKYQARVVVNAIAYKYRGPASGYSEWVFGG